MFLTFLVIIFGLLYVIFKLRYEFAHLPLYIIARLQGQNFKVAKTVNEIKEALMLTDKGTGLEELVAMPAWQPILSLESVNGQKWQELKKNFLIFQKYLPPVSELGLVAKHEVTQLVERDNEINSKDMSILTLKIFVNWMFNEPGCYDNILREEEVERIYQSSIEYRKEIALKGVGCKIKKQDSVNIIVDLLSKSQKYSSVFSDWSQPEYYSIIMQPFIISPMINVSDIAVSVKKNLSALKELNYDTSNFIDYAIRVAHPFPILERYNEKTNTQIVINLIDLKLDEKFNYGYGPRACLGRLYAREFLKEFFEPILKNYDSINFMPEKMHLFSGRDNDNGNLAESIYQLKSILKIFYNLFMERISVDYVKFLKDPLN